MATHIWGNGMEFENPLVVLLDNKVVYETVVGGEEDMKAYDQVQNGALDRVNARLKNIRFKATAGPAQDRRHLPPPHLRRVGRPAADVHEGRRAGPAVPRAVVPGARAVQRQRAERHAEPRSHLRVHASRGRDARGAGGLREDGSSARWRGAPIAGRSTAEDVDELFAYYQDGAKDGGFEGGVRSAVTGVLASPFFLYRGERVPKGLKPGATYTISDRRAGVEPVVLPLEHDSRRRAAAAGHRRPAEAARRARTAGHAHAGRSALGHARRATSSTSGST